MGSISAKAKWRIMRLASRMDADIKPTESMKLESALRLVEPCFDQSYCVVVHTDGPFAVAPVYHRIPYLADEQVVELPVSPRGERQARLAWGCACQVGGSFSCATMRFSPIVKTFTSGFT